MVDGPQLIRNATSYGVLFTTHGGVFYGQKMADPVLIWIRLIMLGDLRGHTPRRSGQQDYRSRSFQTKIGTLADIFTGEHDSSQWLYASHSRSRGFDEGFPSNEIGSVPCS